MNKRLTKQTEEGDWTTGYIGLMTVLLCLFMMLALVYYRKIEEKDLQKKDISKISQEIKESLQSEKFDKYGEVDIEAGKLRIILPVVFTFEKGSAEIKKEAYPVLKTLAEKFKKLENCQIIVEGHTDDSPVWYGARFSSNLELSLYRSLNIVNFFIQEGINPQNLIPIGCGEYHPLVPNDTKENKEKNRRVEISVIAKTS